MIRQATIPGSPDCLCRPDKIRELRQQAGSIFKDNFISLPASDQSRINDHIERLTKYLKELKELKKPTGHQSANEAP